MFVRESAAHSAPSRVNVRHRILWATVSTVALSVMPASVQARGLHGGSASAMAAPNIASEAAALAAQQAAAAARQTQSSLARAARAVQDMQAVQAAARAAAAAAQASRTAPASILNGLGAGGLLPDMAGWTGADAPTQGVDGDGQTQVNVRQVTQQAILDWKSFNVGARTTLTFDQQGKADWVALNRVDASTGPSQILGSIKADGSVYVINQSGIIFGGNSQVNVGSLIASAAKISPEQFRDKGIYSSGSGTNWTPSFTDALGAIRVEAGAQITTKAPTSVTSGGGLVMLLGQSVVNNGMISTPKGQALFAAGDAFVLRSGFSTTGNTASTTRGNEISPVINAGSSSGGVINTGIVFAHQGDITLAGRNLSVGGALIATTSVNTRGTIHLLNRASDTEGNITLAAGSVTAVLPELDSKEEAFDSSRNALIEASRLADQIRAAAATGTFDNLSLLSDRQDQSRIEIVTGGKVIFAGGSYTAAQGGQIAVSAAKSIDAADGALIDVSGVRNVALAMDSNNIRVNVQGNELRDSSQNRDSRALTSNDVWIDARYLTFVAAGTGGYASERYYTPGGLLEVGGHLNTLSHRIDEWTAVAGSITLQAPKLTAHQGARFDISGGSLDVAAGWIYSTNLIGSDGRRYSVDNAPGDMKLIGFAGSFARTHNVQGQTDERLTEVWTTVFDRGRTSKRWEESYSVGRDAGRLNLAAPTSIFAATIIADTVNGERQTTKRSTEVSDGYKLAQGVVAQNGTLALQAYDGNSSTPRWTALASEVRFTDTPAPADRTGTIWLSSDLLTGFGLGGISAWTTKDIVVDRALGVAAGGVIDFQASNVTIAADITARSGRVTIGNEVVGRQPLVDANSNSQMTLRDGAAIDTRGVWTNALTDPSAGRWLVAYIDGGDVTIRTSRNVTLEAGSRIDASAGGMVDRAREVSGGDGGDIALIASNANTSRAGQLTLDGKLVSTGFGKGGALTLETGGAVVIGDASQTQAQALRLATDFFSQGFSSYAINGQNSLTVAANAAIKVTMPTYQVSSALFDLASEGDVAKAATTSLSPLYLDNARKGSTTQRTGADLSLRSGIGPYYTGADGAITIANGAAITVDPGRNVTLVGGGQITVDGRITAHGGRIEIRDGNAAFPTKDAPVPQTGYDPGARSIWIGETAVLDVSGQAHVARDAKGGSYGIVDDGGTIIIGGTGKANSNSILRDVALSHVVIRPGAVLDASGNAGELTVSDLNGVRTVLAASNGGSITVASRSGLYLDGTLRAHAGGAGASGGALSVVFESPLFLESDASWVPAPMRAARILTIAQSVAANNLAADASPGVADPTLKLGHGHITADQIMDGGIDSVQLWTRGGISFDGNVNLTTGRSLTLSHSGFVSGPTTARVWNGGIANTTAGASVRLQSAYVGLIGLAVPKDTIVFADILPATQLGGTLDISAGLIDLQSDIRFKYADTVLTSRGDIRVLATPSGLTMVGTSGNLTLVAQQVYPASGATATLFAGMDSTGTKIADMNAKLRILSVDGSRPAAPYSVFGSLTLAAPTIQQGGVVRAPLGSITIGTHLAKSATDNYFTRVELLPGSLTSVSAAGLVMPYGGTTDGVNYTADGVAAVAPDLVTGAFGGVSTRQGVTINAGEVTSAAGSVIDLSGGGTLAGTGFVSGRGGSVDVLVASLAEANPANRKLGTNNAVYALVPGAAVAPVTGGTNAIWTGDAPGIGQQVTIPAGVPGLAAGTYTLMPANYALLPGAFRVEVAPGHVAATTAPVALANGSYLASGTLGIANTSIRDALPTMLVLTPGSATRTFSQYNEQSYADFQLAQASRFGTVRPMLERDGKFLSISLMTLDGGNVASTKQSTRDALTFEGRALFAAGEGGYGGTLNLGAVSNVYLTGAQSTLEIVKAGTPVIRTSRVTPVSNAAIAAIGAPNLNLGGVIARNESTVGWDYTQLDPGTHNIIIDSGVVLRGSQIIMSALYDITIASGARIDTLGWGVQAPDSVATGLTYGLMSSAAINNNNMAAIVAVSNGNIAFSAPSGVKGSVTIGDGATLLSEGSIGFLVPASLAVNGTPVIGTRSLNLTVPTLNIGSAASLAAARAAGTLPNGMAFDQNLFDRLLTGGAGGAPAVETLVLGASNSINFFGSVNLDTIDPATGRSRLKQFQFNSPAIYGAGTAGDQVRISADTLIWNGFATTASGGSQPSPSKAPGATIPGGPGHGAGTITVDARRIVLGFGPNERTFSQVNYERLMLGFGTVNLNASEAIVANNRGTLAVFASGPSPDATYSGKTYAGIGGTLNLVTPLLTGDPGAVLAIRAGGNVRVTQPATASNAPRAKALGGDVAITSGGSMLLDTAVYLPSGRFSATAAGDLVLGVNAKLDLSGQAIQMFDVTEHSWGGDVLFESTRGNIRQMAGSVIDISAANNNAGSLTLTATGTGAGRVALDGTLKAGGVQGGSFDLRAQLIAGSASTLSADFAALNATLNATGFTESRSFVLKQGDLVIGSELKAHDVAVSVDGGSLTVTGKVDASGERAGAIRLAARGDMVLASTAILDAHGTMLQVDSNGVAIGAKNRALVEVGSTQGTVRLASGATIDLSSPDGTTRGTLSIYAPRVGSGTSATGNGAPANAVGNDVAIDAAQGLAIRGAREIALYGITTYKNAPTSTNPNEQVINKAWMDLVHQDNLAFVSGALANAGLQVRLAGLTAYGSAFHLRPGVEIASATDDGHLLVSGDVDLSGYRYGGEAMGLTLRAGGDVTVKGNLSDGYRLLTPGQAGGPKPIPTILGNTTDFNTTKKKNVFIGDVRVQMPYYDNKQEIVLASNWVIPSTDFYVEGYGSIPDASGTRWRPGDTVPAGTVFIALGLPLELADPASWPAVQYVLKPTAATFGDAMAGPATALRVVAGADVTSAALRTLAAASALNGSGNLVLNNPTFAAATGAQSKVQTTSMLRTTAADLNLLAGGDLKQLSAFNISTLGGGDAAPADVFVKTQGMLTGQVYVSATSPIGTTSATVSRWYGQNGKNFTGFGALNGGNVTLIAGGDAGMLKAHDGTVLSLGYTNTAIVAGIHGGGDVRISIGGALNPLGYGGAVGGTAIDDINGVFSTDRGDITLQAGSIGVIPLVYGTAENNDPRQADPLTATAIGASAGGPMLMPRDGLVSVASRGDLVIGGYGSAGTSAKLGWSDRTAVSLFSTGGNLVPINANRDGRPNDGYANDGPDGLGQFHLPSSFSAIAASGSIYVQGALANADKDIVVHVDAAPNGGLELLAGKSIYGAATYDSITKSKPVRFDVGGSEIDPTMHQGDDTPIRIYGVTGDVVNVTLGEARPLFDGSTVYVGAKKARVMAGRDMVGFGLTTTRVNGYNVILPSFILHTDANDVSVISAGRNMYFTNVEIAGPGTLEVTAGGDIYQGYKGLITSLGPIAKGDNRPGASIAVMAGAGAAGARYDNLLAYLDPTNLAVSGKPLADQVGKVAKTYEGELRKWLQDRYGFAAADDAEARSYFFALAPEQQRIFLREVYYAELTAGGREYNDAASSRFGSYLRGRQAIAALFPEGNNYRGDLVMFSGTEKDQYNNVTNFDSGIRTLFGGDIQIMTPGGQQVIGVEGIAPGAKTGLVTQGQGNMQLYAEGSILLGQSRVMTTFGGDIVAWSATGDINAGRGSKTSVLYTPPKRVYDKYGRVTLSPQVPATGAGIATLNPIPEVPAGDIDLIAPLGTIDAGEAGIRVSGNINLAALQVLNAANIEVQGMSSGIPTVQSPNISAALSTSNATAATQQAATPSQGSGNERPSVIIVEVLGYGGGPNGEDDERRDREKQRRDERSGYNPNSALQLIGNGALTEGQQQRLTETERRNFNRIGL